MPAQAFRCGRLTALMARHRRRAQSRLVSLLFPGSQHAQEGTATRAIASEVQQQAYGAEKIQVLKGLEPVRLRPGMYIGSTGTDGLHHLIWEIVDNAIDEVQAGHASCVDVHVDCRSRWVRVRDDGRGIPTDVHESTGKSALETVLTVLHAGGKFGAGGYMVSGGLHGVGLSVVNALSERLEVSVWRDSKVHSQAFERGVPLGPMSCAPAPTSTDGTTPASGTEISFCFDPTVFKTSGLTFNLPRVSTRLRELAFLNRGCTIRFTGCSDTAPAGPGSKQARAGNGVAAADEAGTAGEAVVDVSETFHYNGGIVEYVELLNSTDDEDSKALHKCLFISGEADDVVAEVALQWTARPSETLLSFVNCVKTPAGGTHLDAAKQAVTRVLNKVARDKGLLKDGDGNLVGEHVREGLTMVVSVKVPNPEFEGQTKARLGSPKVKTAVAHIVADVLEEQLRTQPAALRSVVDKALLAQKAAAAAKRAREMVRRKSVLSRATLPGKLADCTSTSLAETEIFIVEGDSAAGSAKQARDRMFQAILPLRGKVLNVEKADDVAILKNKELSNLVIGLGLRIRGEGNADGSSNGNGRSSPDSAGKAPEGTMLDPDLERLRYGKIILLTDADVDGAHIRTLLLTFLYRYQSSLFSNGCVYVGLPPLYKVEAGKRKPVYCYSDEEKNAALAQLPGGVRPHVQRFKGLGEMMPDQLWETTMDPARRKLLRLTTDDVQETEKVIRTMMGSDPSARKKLIQDLAAQHVVQVDV